MTDIAQPRPDDKPDPVTRLIAVMVELGAASAADLARAAGMGYSTTTPKLRALQADGRAEKVRTKDRRTLWQLIRNGQPTRSTHPDGEQADSALPDAEPAPDTNAADTLTGIDTVDDDVEDAAAVDAEPDQPQPTATDRVPDGSDAAPQAGTEHPEPGTTADPDTATGSDADAVPVVGDAEVAAPPDTATATEKPQPGPRRPRRRKGQLRNEVLAVLQNEPDRTFGATGLSQRLDGASEGAIANALDKLVTGGSAHLVQDKPARWQAV